MGEPRRDNEPDIVDRIDESVDEQLAGYHERSGYDYNVGEQACPHCPSHTPPMWANNPTRTRRTRNRGSRL